MQVTDAMVAKALNAYDAAVPEDNGASANGMRAALTAALAEMWRPVSEHDGDMTPVIVWTGDEGWPCGVARWRSDLVVPFWEGLDGEMYNATHFMPLPAPPMGK